MIIRNIKCLFVVCVQEIGHLGSPKWLKQRLDSKIDHEDKIWISYWCS